MKFTSPTFTASGRAWRIVCVATEDGSTAGSKAQVRANEGPEAWEDWHARKPFGLPRAVRKYADNFQARCLLRLRNRQKEAVA